MVATRVMVEEEGISLEDMVYKAGRFFFYEISP
jgi:hypothetical protein